jgi:hypothetical protein
MAFSHRFFSVCTLFLLACSLHVAGRDNDTVLFSPQQLQDDAGHFFSTLHWQHPDPYYYCGIEVFEKKKADIFRQLDHPMTKHEFLMIIGAINSCLDAHSGINVNVNGLPSFYRWVDSLRQGGLTFPNVGMDAGQLVADIRGKRLKLHSVNGIEIETVLNHMKQYIGVSPLCYINRHIEFQFAYWADTYFNIRSPFIVTYRDGKQIKETVLSGIPFDHSKAHHYLEKKIHYDVYPGSSIALLKINTCNPEILEKEGFDHVVKTLLDSIRSCNVRHLFIDVSANGGGNPEGLKKLFECFRHDTVYFNYARFDKPSEFKYLYRPYQSEVFCLPNEAGFNGNLYVLQSEFTASAADFFCRMVARNGLGIRIGKSTGSFTKEFTFANTADMPNTRIGITIANALIDFSHDWDTESLDPDLFWEMDDTQKITEEDLKNMIQAWSKQKVKNR